MEFVCSAFIKCLANEQKLNKEVQTFPFKSNEKMFKEFKTRFMVVAQDYYRCSQLIDLLEEQMTAKWFEKQKYCKFKAAKTI